MVEGRVKVVVVMEMEMEVEVVDENIERREILLRLRRSRDIFTILLLRLRRMVPSNAEVIRIARISRTRLSNHYATHADRMEVEGVDLDLETEALEQAKVYTNRGNDCLIPARASVGVNVDGDSDGDGDGTWVPCPFSLGLEYPDDTPNPVRFTEDHVQN